MNKVLILITSHFPFGLGESFLEPEIQILQENFKKIFIISKDVSSVKSRSISPNIKIIRYNSTNSFFQNLEIPWLVLKNFKLFLSVLFFELSTIHNDLEISLSFAVLKNLIHDLVKSLQLKDFINNLIIREKLGKELVLYSYWFDTSALALSFLNVKSRSIIKISRAHRGDLYFESNENNYLSFQKWKILTLDKIFCISEQGKEYLIHKFNAAVNNCYVARLGVDPAPLSVKHNLKEPFVLVSCSFIKKVKCIELIINALGLINNTEIKWIHLGEGELSNEMEELARQRLSGLSNIEYHFKGAMSQKEIINFYSETWVDLFINVSSSEGIPVSIMEALSFGIPVIATDVGGLKEIVNQDNGLLINVNSSPPVIASNIKDLLSLTHEQKTRMRKSAFKMWEENYNARVNFSKFSKLIVK